MDKSSTINRIWSRIQRENYQANRPEARELRRLRRTIGKIPRYELGQIDTWGWRLRYADAASCISAFDYIVNRGWIAFKPDTESPRILDCGANIGIASLYYKRLLPNARITAFEPDHQLCGLLRRNLAENAAQDVEVVEAALWDAEGEMTFLSTGDDSGRVSSALGSAVIPVQTIRLVGYLEDPVDLLKLDIEGAEGRVITDCSGYLRNVKHLILEYHFTDDPNNHLSGILHTLESSGFIFSINSPPNTWASFPSGNLSTDGEWMRNWLMIYAVRL